MAKSSKSRKTTTTKAKANNSGRAVESPIEKRIAPPIGMQGNHGEEVVNTGHLIRSMSSDTPAAEFVSPGGGNSPNYVEVPAGMDPEKAKLLLIKLDQAGLNEEVTMSFKTNAKAEARKMGKIPTLIAELAAHANRNWIFSQTILGQTDKLEVGNNQEKGDGDDFISKDSVVVGADDFHSLALVRQLEQLISVLTKSNNMLITTQDKLEFLLT